jgi:hypothetical protein
MEGLRAAHNSRFRIGGGKSVGTLDNHETVLYQCLNTRMKPLKGSFCSSGVGCGTAVVERRISPVRRLQERVFIQSQGANLQNVVCFSPEISTIADYLLHVSRLECTLSLAVVPSGSYREKSDRIMKCTICSVFVNRRADKRGCLSDGGSGRLGPATSCL